MTKLNGQSEDILQDNIAAVRELFPEVCCEGKIDFDKLRQVLGEYVDDDKERYNFTWNGKGKALRLSQTPSMGTLRPCKEESKNWDTTQNLYIEGDNLEVLKLLQKSYHGRIKMIYIDPPYNTGNDFVYPDDFSDSLENYKKITGQVDDEGNKVSTNSEANGRYHTDWLNMMYPRLRLARNLLADDGVIFISISEEEVQTLKSICNEVFGESNFRNAISTRRYDKNLSLQFVDQGLPSMSIGFEYILMYSKTTDIKFNAVYREADAQRAATGYWKGFWNDADRPTMRFDILGVIPADGQWKWKKELAEEAVSNYQTYVKDFESTMTLEEYWKSTGENKKFIRRNLNGKGKNQGVEHWVAPSNKILRNSNWTDMLASKKPNFDVPFDSPKNPDIIKELLKLSNTGEAGIVLDFFSGSATTAHAVMQLNAEDGGNRKFIMVQLPEPCAEGTEAAKAGYKNICEIGKERIRRAGEKIKTEVEEQNAQMKLGEEPKKVPDIGFKDFKLDTSNLRKWQPNYDDLEASLFDSISNYVDGRTELDVVYEIMLKMGLDLTWPVETHSIGGKNVYTIGMGALMICLDDDITTAVADGMVALYKELAPETWKVVFKDNGFKDDSAKTNIHEILKCAGLDEDAFTTV